MGVSPSESRVGIPKRPSFASPWPLFRGFPQNHFSKRHPQNLIFQPQEPPPPATSNKNSNVQIIPTVGMKTKTFKEVSVDKK
jgi:hypothetical protein